jgi:hypothetical protein
MFFSKERAAEQLAELNQTFQKHQELNEFRERLETLEACMDQAYLRAEGLENKNAQLRIEKQHQQNQAAFYQLIIEMVSTHEQLQTIWDDLVVTMKLLDPEIEKKFIAINQGTNL